MPNQPPAAAAKGFKNWTEIFRSGTHTDGHGQQRTWTHADLDQIVANHSAASPAPLVIGHPQTDSPAYGWSDELKRDGDTLFAKFVQVPDAVERAVESGAYRNRSIKVVKGTSGWKLAHVGLLGATPPAIEGLAPVYSAAAGGETYEFGLLAPGSQAWLARSIARGLRTFREYVIGKFGLEEADKAMPSWSLDDLERAAAEAELQADSLPRPFNAPEPQESAVFTQADIDAAVAKAREEEAAKLKPLQEAAQAAAFAQRLTENKAFISTLVSDKDGKVRLLPADADGWAEALTFAQDLAASEFTFAAADGAKQEPKLYEFLKGKLGALAPVLELRKQQAADDVRLNLADSAAIQSAAQEFQASEAQAGRHINIAEAVTHVTHANKAA